MAIADVAHASNGGRVGECGGVATDRVDVIGAASAQHYRPSPRQGCALTACVGYVQEGTVAGRVQLDGAVVGDGAIDHGRAVVVDRIRSRVGQVAQER